MRITVDTNVLISSTFWEGDSSKIIKKVETGELKLILSESIIKEFEKVLNYNEIQDKIKNKNLEMKYSINKIVSLSIIIDPLQKLNICEDSNDNIILECALEGQVNYLISQDNHLLKLKEIQGIKIITPNEFLSIINNKTQ